jgi:hypothetical protein
MIINVCLVNLSISENDETESLGFSEMASQPDYAAVCIALLSQGVGVVLATNGANDGLMEAVHGFACSEETDSEPLLLERAGIRTDPWLSEEPQERSVGTRASYARAAERPRGFRRICGPWPSPR